MPTSRGDRVARSFPWIAAVLLFGACTYESPAPATAPPRRTAAIEVVDGPTCTGTGAHDAHGRASLSCSACHPCGGALGFGDVTYTRGTSTAGGTIVPSTPDNPASCTVACHYPLGTPVHEVTWDMPGPLACTSCHAVSAFPPAHPALSVADPTRADCEACHDTNRHTSGDIVFVRHPDSWMAVADPGFHAYSANRGLANCQACHGQDLTGGYTSTACARCHDANLPPGIASWRVNCVMCHGGTDNATGAPPRTTWGRGDDLVRVGAHTSHVEGSPIAPAFECNVCHVKPTDALSPGHVDAETASVVFSGIAANHGDPQATWDRTTATCSSTYCHGATLAGGTNKTPVWTGGPGEAGCGTCHGVPPPSPHPSVVGGLERCVACHPETIDPAGVVIPPASGGLHLDGVVEARGHEASWMDPGSTNFHAYSANAGLGSCQTCHGDDLSGGTVGLACASCHDGVQAPPWGTCTMCHGGTDDITGAPPKATWANRENPVKIGAHSSHVAANPVSSPMDCIECHPTPAELFAPGHVDGAVQVRFEGPLSALRVATWNYPPAPTCSSTYCHGNFLRGNTANTPDWTGIDQAACGTCHPARPANYLHYRHQRNYDTGSIPWWPVGGGSTWVTCDQCHSGIASSTSSWSPTALTPSNGSGPPLHVNGSKDVVFKNGGSYDKATRTCSGLACHPGEQPKTWN